MGLFSRSTPPQRPAVSTGQTYASLDLVNPGLPSGTHKQLGYELMCAAGLTFAVHGPGTAADLFEALLPACPWLADSHVAGACFGAVNDKGAWTAWESDNGALLAYAVFPEADTRWVISRVQEPFANIGWPRRSSIVTLGSADSDAAAIINAGRLVPMWDLPGLEHLAPKVAPVSLPYQQLVAATRERLLGGGAEALDGGMLKAVLGVDEARTQLLFVGTEPRLSLMSPIARTTPDGAVPAVLGALDPGAYDVTVAGDLVMLWELVEDKIPLTVSVDDVMARAVALCRFADTVEAATSTEDAL